MSVEKMPVEDKFTHEIEITKVRMDNTDEGNLNLKVKTTFGILDLECFVHGGTAFGLYKGSLYKGGDVVKVRFALLSYEDSIRATLSKDGRRVSLDPECAKNPYRGNIDYIVQGEVLQVRSHEDPVMAQKHVRIVLDCGIYLYTTLPKSINAKVGNYFQMQGRLDAHIVGKVN